MKLSALVATFVLGLSSVAVAAPSVRDHRQPVPVAFRPAPVQRWTLLDASNAREGRNVIRVKSKQRFSKLKLDATRGALVVDKVIVTFANGRTHTIDLDMRIGAGSGARIIDLPGASREIDRIVVVTRGRSRASYTVHAA
jgi:hypothetical protein